MRPRLGGADAAAPRRHGGAGGAEAREVTVTTPRRFDGVYSVLVTPFTAAGGIDLDGVARVVDHAVDSGVTGVVTLGLASEVGRLTDDEREALVAAVVAAADGRVEVVAGTEHAAGAPAARRAAHAAGAGADALMAFPPAGAAEAQLVAYYAGITEASGLPVIVQDAPAWTQVRLSTDLLARVGREVPLARHVKVEAPPTPPRIAALHAAGLECIGGLGGLYLAEELDRGVTATMPGCLFPGVYVEMLRSHAAGDSQVVQRAYAELLPLTVSLMSSLDVFVAVHKHVLWRRGLIATPALRGPAQPPDARQLDWCVGLAERLTDRFLPRSRGTRPLG
ncbi:MAG: hypothetical protein GEV10_23635 [Streptosporangiales bacterium]|nr:hypothetical protein [Streptosporangiales bacterium]